jgi:amidase
MRTRLIGAALGVGAAATLAALALRNTTLRESLKLRMFMVDQVRREYPGLATSAKRTLDATPFREALLAIGEARLRTVAALVEMSDIAGMQQAMHDTTITAEELTLHYIQRILQRNPGLNAVIELNPDALSQARACDAERQAGLVRGPLHGIPILLKDNIATGDRMHTTAGAAALSEASSDRDAFLVHRLRQAGAVLLGKNNMSEWAYFMSSRGVCGYSALGGQTHNPHGRFEVGGSSSGSAVAVAAGLCAAAVGTETNGSLVYPASQNGIVTLKPSLGLISRDRIIPITDAQDTAGPMARGVADAALLMDVLAGSDPNDPLTDTGRSAIAAGFRPGANGLRGVRVGLVRKMLLHGDDLAYTQLAAALRLAGADVRDIPAPPSIDSSAVLLHGFRHGLDAYLRDLRGYVPVGSLTEIVAFNQRDLATYAPYGQQILEKALTISTTDSWYQEQARRNRELGEQLLHKVLSEHRVDLIATLSNYLSSVAAVPGLPSIGLPLTRRSTGEPINATLIGERFSDAQLFSAAAALEQAVNSL